MNPQPSQAAVEADSIPQEAVEALASFLCSEFDFDLNPITGASWPEHENDDGYRGDSGYVRLQPSDVQARARENARRILIFLGQQASADHQASAQDGPPFHFDRYVNGQLMAEGVTIEREQTLEAAFVAAARLAAKGPNGETPVLILRTHSAPKPAEPVAVKELTWDRYVDPPFIAYARTRLGTYQVKRGHAGSGWWWWFSGNMGDEGHSSEEEAKAAAQADFEARIRDALAPAPVPAEPVASADEDRKMDANLLRQTAVRLRQSGMHTDYMLAGSLERIAAALSPANPAKEQGE